jgi:hypothetical protein
VLRVTLNTGVTVTLTASVQGTALSGPYTVEAGHNTGSLIVTGMNASGVFDLAGNVAANNILSPNAISLSGIVIDTLGPTVLRFESSSADGTYGIGSAVNITAIVSEPIASDSTMTVTLSTGSQITLIASASGTTLIGTYVVAAGHTTADLDVIGTATANTRDLAGNAIGNTSLGLNTMSTTRNIVIAGGIKLVTPVGFSGISSLIPDRRAAATSIPITFNTSVSGLTLASFRLLLNGRSVSLRGARLTGSGTNYTLTMPSRLTNTKGIYTLMLSAAAIKATSNGAAMTEDQGIYWGKGKSVGFTQPKKPAKAPILPVARVVQLRR